MNHFRCWSAFSSAVTADVMKHTCSQRSSSRLMSFTHSPRNFIHRATQHLRTIWTRSDTVKNVFINFICSSSQLYRSLVSFNSSGAQISQFINVFLCAVPGQNESELLLFMSPKITMASPQWALQTVLRASIDVRTDRHVHNRTTKSQITNCVNRISDLNYGFCVCICWTCRIWRDFSRVLSLSVSFLGCQMKITSSSSLVVIKG